MDTWPGHTFQIICCNFQTSAEYFYVDVWSSPFTWGGGPLPKDGDFVVISKGQNILLDVDSPKLKIILIRGRALLASHESVNECTKLQWNTISGDAAVNLTIFDVFHLIFSLDIKYFYIEY